MTSTGYSVLNRGQAMRKEIEENASIFIIWAPIIGPGVASECQCKVGLHF